MKRKPAPDMAEVLRRLRAKYPTPHYELHWQTPLQLLIATMLAARTTDERVNKVTPLLFAKYPDAAAIASANIRDLERIVKSTGAYRTKARAIKAACKVLVERFGGEVPRTMEELLELPGVGRKTANVVLGEVFGVAEGIMVDRHVARVARRLGVVRTDDPETIERELMEKVPKNEWTFVGPAMVLHGRYTCTARAPKCSECVLESICPKIGVEPSPRAIAPARSPKR